MTGAAHEFDFWIGEWDVFGPEGRQVGRNTITSMFGNGMLHEHWHGNGGVEGRSINAYDGTRGRWHQTWMDSTGDMLLLEGGLVDDAMVLEGKAPNGDDPTVVDRQRITWTQTSDSDGAEVRQLWESSSDDGATWTVAFDGRYRRH
jgi:hypothetical protein